jgi:hypothetical protein
MQDPAIVARSRRGSSTPRHYRRLGAQGGPAALRIISQEFAVVCLFSLLGLTLTAAALSYLSDETISVMFSSVY